MRTFRQRKLFPKGGKLFSSLAKERFAHRTFLRWEMVPNNPMSTCCCPMTLPCDELVLAQNGCPEITEKGMTDHWHISVNTQQFLGTHSSLRSVR